MTDDRLETIHARAIDMQIRRAGGGEPTTMRWIDGMRRPELYDDCAAVCEELLAVRETARTALEKANEITMPAYLVGKPYADAARAMCDALRKIAGEEATDGE